MKILCLHLIVNWTLDFVAFERGKIYDGTNK